MSKRKILTASDLRGILLTSIQGVLEGKTTVGQANSIVGLSGEVHKSLRQEWDMRVFANEHLSLDKGEVIKLILDGEGDD